MATTSLNFGAQIDEWTRKTEGALRAVFQTAASYTIKDVILRTPVDTGFLRASLVVNLTGPLPANRGGRVKPAGHVAGTQIYPDQPYALAINGADIGDTIFASFVANYAGYVEYGTSRMAPRGFVRLAAQNWQQNVNNAVTHVRSTLG